MTIRFSIRNPESSTELIDKKATEVDVSFECNDKEIRISIYKAGLIEINDGKTAYAIELMGTNDTCLVAKPPVARS